MNTKTVVAAMLVGVSAVIGCVSIDQTRTQLASSNPQDVQKAENNIFVIATTGKDPTGLMQFNESQQIEYVNLVSDNVLLFKIIDKAYQDKVILATAARIDFSKQGIGMEILTKHENVLKKVARAEPQNLQANAERDMKMKMSKGQKTQVASSGPMTFADKVFASLSENELRQALDMNGVDYDMKEKIASKLVNDTKDANLLMSFYDGDLRYRIKDYEREGVILKLAGMADRLNSVEMVEKILNAVDPHSLNPYVKNYDERVKLFAKLNDDKTMEYAMKSVDKQSVRRWGTDQMYFIYDGVAAANTVKDINAKVELVSAVLSKIEEIKQSCGSSMLSWDAKEEKKAADIINRLPKFDDATMEQLICKDDSSWKSFDNAVTPNVAYNVLRSGKAKSVEVEMAMIKKLSKDKLDAVVYKGARFAMTRKAIYNSMAPEMKKKADAERESAYKAIVKKAADNAKETFVLDGFYLGMDFDDMLIVFDYVFPEVQFEESIDGKGDNADYAITLAGEKMPFCYASVKDKKIYQFNFRSKVLKKWFKYDVQNYGEWASAYNREFNADFRYKMIERDTTIYEPFGSASYHVWLYQHSYQYKNNAKGYRLTYFGEQKDFSIEGGLGGAVIKSLAAEKFRYTRDEPGTLRVKIERD